MELIITKSLYEIKEGMFNTCLGFLPLVAVS